MLIPDTATIDPNAVLHSRSDITGHFTFRGIAPGPYKLLAWEDANPDELLADQEGLKSFADQGDALNVEEGGQYTVFPKVIPLR
jgi:hypothetical protein